MEIVFDVETTGLKPMEDRITCISILNLEHNAPVSFYGENESLILKQFWNAIKDVTKAISFNGDGFDIAFLIKRSLINNVRVTNLFKNHIDLKKVVNCFFFTYNKYEKGKLTDWGKILGIKVITENGAEMIKHYEKKDWKTIKAHCEEDVMLTKALFMRCKECGLLE